MCVRKRPLGLREERRGEVNIITVKDKETLLLHEKKEAVDLTQYILQVTCSTCSLCLWATCVMGLSRLYLGFQNGETEKGFPLIEKGASCIELDGELFCQLLIAMFELLLTYASLWQKT